MSQPKTIRAGFKSPPLDSLKGRGPPTTKKRDSFFDRNSPITCHYILYFTHKGERPYTLKGW